jgi:hypothetical protein
MKDVVDQTGVGTARHAAVTALPAERMVQNARAKGYGPDGSRTRDLMNAIHARSQLRYWPTWLGREPQF